MRGFLDRDFLKTTDGFLFCVVGDVHPDNRVVSYLRYIPSTYGRWGKGDYRYSRAMLDYTTPSLAENIEYLAKHHPHYLFHSDTLNIRMSAVPVRRIAKRFLPEEKLGQLFEYKRLDPLQERVLQLVNHLSDGSSIPVEGFGVTGSILADIHQPQFSDIDLVVYGGENGWRIKGFLEEEAEAEGSLLTKPRGEGVERLLDRWVKKRPLTPREAEDIFRRRWNYGFFRETAFSVHNVKTEGEVGEGYGDKVFKPLKIVEGVMEVTGVDASLYLPSVYDVNPAESLEEGLEVEKIVSYDGFYGGIFQIGDIVHVRGKLEAVLDKRSGRRYHRILVGSLEAGGRDFIKPDL